MKNVEPKTHATDAYEPPEWLNNTLHLYMGQTLRSRPEAALERPSEDFLQRCREAADVAASVARLRTGRRQLGFVPMALADYIRGLAKVAGVQLSVVLARFGLDDAALQDPGSVRGLARLARDLGIGLRETLIHLRIGFVEKIDAVPVTLLLAHHRAPGVLDQLGECEAVLRLAEAKYESGWLDEVRRAEFEIRAAYKEDESEG